MFLYYPMLLISAVLFIISERFLCFGDGILVWGLINFRSFISNKFCIGNKMLFIVTDIFTVSDGSGSNNRRDFIWATNCIMRCCVSRV